MRNRAPRDLVAPLGISHGSSTAANLFWTVASQSFLATSHSTTLRFTSNSTSTPLGGILLDGVDVTGGQAPAF